VVGGVKHLRRDADMVYRALDRAFELTHFDDPKGPQYAWTSEEGRATLEQSTGRKWYPHPDDPHCLCSEPWTQTMLDEWNRTPPT
jgi:hypothetical protein